MVKNLLKILLSYRTYKKILKHKNVSLVIDNTANIENEIGKLNLGAVWDAKDPFKSLMVLRSGARLLIKGNFRIYSGAKVYINKDATLILGSGYVNHNLNLSCFNKIEIGEQVAISENVTIRDSDNHEIVNAKKPMTQPIKIGDHVWIGMNVTILKGVTIGNGAIIAAGSLVNKNVSANTLVGGVPAVVIKNSVAWK